MPPQLPEWLTFLAQTPLNPLSSTHPLGMASRMAMPVVTNPRDTYLQDLFKGITTLGETPLNPLDASQPAGMAGRLMMGRPGIFAPDSPAPAYPPFNETDAVGRVADAAAGMPRFDETNQVGRVADMAAGIPQSRRPRGLPAWAGGGGSASPRNFVASSGGSYQGSTGGAPGATPPAAAAVQTASTAKSGSGLLPKILRFLLPTLAGAAIGGLSGRVGPVVGALGGLAAGGQGFLKNQEKEKDDAIKDLWNTYKMGLEERKVSALENRTAAQVAKAGRGGGTGGRGAGKQKDPFKDMAKPIREVIQITGARELDPKNPQDREVVRNALRSHYPTSKEQFKDPGIGSRIFGAFGGDVKDPVTTAISTVNAAVKQLKVPGQLQRPADTPASSSGFDDVTVELLPSD